MDVYFLKGSSNLKRTKTFMRKLKQSKSEVFDYRGLWCLKSECKHVGDPAKINTKGKMNYLSAFSL